MVTILGGGFQYVLFSSLFGQDSHFDEYVSDGLKPPNTKLTLFTTGTEEFCMGMIYRDIGTTARS